VREAIESSEVLTISDTAAVMRCSKAHVANLVNGKVRGAPPLASIRVGRRRLIRRTSLDRWMEAAEQSGGAK
jgi:excisionase family DNA binding protein